MINSCYIYVIYISPVRKIYFILYYSVDSDNTPGLVLNITQTTEGNVGVGIERGGFPDGKYLNND